MDAQIGFADALRWILPTRLTRYVVFHGWIRQETLCDRSSVTFDLRQCGVIPGQRHISACLSRQRAIVFDRTRLTVFALRRVHVALFFLVEPASMQLPTLRTDQSVSLVDEAARAHQSVFLNEPQW